MILLMRSEQGRSRIFHNVMLLSSLLLFQVLDRETATVEGGVGHTGARAEPADGVLIAEADVEHGNTLIRRENSSVLGGS